MNVLGTAVSKFHDVRTLVSAGIVRPARVDRLVRVVDALRTYGPSPAAGYAVNAARYPDALAVCDEAGTLTFAEVHERSHRLAHGLRGLGVQEGDGVAVMCRNHRGFVDTVVALSKLGAHALFLNTMFAGPQLRDVLEREGPKAVVLDGEFFGLLGEAASERIHVIAWPGEHGEGGDAPTVEGLIAAGDPGGVPAPVKAGRVTILTSGTTGTPKGANRESPSSLEPAAALLSKIPLHAREATVIAAPLFHSWGFAHFTIGMALSSTIVLRRRFDPEDTLAAVAEHRATALAVVPVMMQRILALPPEVTDRYDLRTLRVVAASGSALPGPLAQDFMDRFGDVVYNLYGSTEVAWATIATPEDMRAAPGTAGRPPRGTVVRLYDQQTGAPIEEPDRVGRIFVGNSMLFDGYTGGGTKDAKDGLMATGDVGHFDADGRLFVDGRDDDMIVSGGENVFPAEVEDLLAGHAAVDEVAVIGVDDEQFGQRLKAFVVLRPGASLSEAEVKSHVKEHLASFKVPREVVFLDELPRNATGKVLKRELK